jgi:glutathione S-transferase
MTLRIYGAGGSGNSHKPKLLASLLGLDFTFVDVNLGQLPNECENNSPEFLTLNPSGQVPVVVDSTKEQLDGISEEIFASEACLQAYGPKGAVIRDSNGSLVYLATIAAEADPSLQHWFPVGDALALARVATWMSFATNEVNTSLLFVRIAVVFEWKIPITLEAAIAKSRSCLAYLEARLAEGADRGELWLASSDKPTIADIAVFPYVAMAEASSKGAVSLETYPQVRAWILRVRALSGYVNQEGSFE